MPGDGALTLGVRGPDGQERTLAFDRDVITVGRARDCALPLESGFISRNHARLERHGSAWYVADEGSKNGVVLNGQRIPTGESHVIVRGDTLRIGDYSLTIEAAGPVPGSAAPALEALPAGPMPDSALAAVRTTPLQSAPEDRPAIRQETLSPHNTIGGEPDPTEAAGKEPPAQVQLPGPVSRPAVTGLTAREAALLNALRGSGTAGRSTDELVEAVWGRAGGDSEMLERLVHRLELKLGAGTPPSATVERIGRAGFRLQD